MGNEEKTITLTADKDVLITHRNAFQKTLLDNILDLRRHEYIKTVKPDYQRKNQQGKYIGIDELIEDYKKGAANAKSYVDIIDELLEMDNDGKLSEAWAGIGESKEEEAKPEEVESPAEVEKPQEEKKEEAAE